MFHRGQDFTQSHAQLNVIFAKEFKEATVIFPKSDTAEKLHGNLVINLDVYSSGKNHFTTNDLSPALRHFINDTCRLLEPLSLVLAEKYPDVVPGRTESLNSYLKKLQDSSKTLGFDVDFIIELYEVWNDYKHRNTKGAYATPWKYENGIVVKPQLELPPLNITTVKLDSLNIDTFQNETSKKVLELLNFIT